ncbi:MAG: SMP-30/gluconolactonase/LRE family protein [Kiritimatiellae bacterium]|nr:SMP-30/gluconolactonase/LRE family protein [Kiritimatiellia bacterium]
MSTAPDLIVDCACATGENPYWHAAEQRVYWVDIPGCRLFRHDPATGQTEAFETEAPVGGFTVQPDGRLLLFMARGAVKLWRDGEYETVLAELAGEQDNRFNDVIADPEGRVYGGTMSTRDRAGALYRLDTDGSITKLVEGIGTSNGLGFTPDLKRMYHTDTRARAIYLYDYDRATGAITNRRVFVRTPDEPAQGRPDGMTVDADGCVWSARWDGARIVRYSPAGEELSHIAFPAPKCSSLAFGGPDFTDIYVTTAGGNKREADGPAAGALFCVNVGVKGVPEFLSRVGAD